MLLKRMKQFAMLLTPPLSLSFFVCVRSWNPIWLHQMIRDARANIWMTSSALFGDNYPRPCSKTCRANNYFNGRQNRQQISTGYYLDGDVSRARQNTSSHLLIVTSSGPLYERETRSLCSLSSLFTCVSFKILPAVSLTRSWALQDNLHRSTLHLFDGLSLYFEGRKK